MKVPTPVKNLYADLRDRRMLSIAIVLIAAIIAVPFLLGGSGEEDIPPPPSVTAGAPFDGDEQLDPVVLAEAPGLRDFHERLEGYDSHNPFKVRLSKEEREALKRQENAAGGGGGAGPGTDATEAPVEAVPTPPEVPEVTVPETGTEPTDPGTGDGTGAGDGSTGSGGELITYRIDVRVGPVGHSEVFQDVEQLEFLPDRRHPLVEYIEADTNGSRVAFIVNPTAAAVKGDAECVRSRKDCQYLVMSPGDEMYFIFEDRQYRIELKDIIEHREPYTPGGASDEDQDPAQRELVEALGG